MKGYEKLDDVLARAFKQASEGKGKERHANDLPFHEQPMQQVNRMVGVGFSHGQAIKKIVESQNMPPEQAVHELLGAICYIAGGIITLEAANDNKQPVKAKSLSMFLNGEPVNMSLVPEIKNAVREYLDENYKLVEVEVGTMFIPDNWIRVPEGVQCAIKRKTDGCLKFSTHPVNHEKYETVWQRDQSARPASADEAREKAREILANMRRGEIANVYGRMISFNHQGLFVEGYWHSDSLKETLDYLLEGK